MTVTSAQVAEAAGVSRATVSYVLNNKVGQTISSATRELVERTARELGYRPSAAARSLRSGKGLSVLFPLPGLRRSHVVMQLVETCTRALAAEGLSLVPDHAVYADCDEQLDAWLRLAPCAVIDLVLRHDDPVLPGLRRHGVPVMSSAFAETDARESSSDTYVRAVRETQLAHLLDQGCRSIALVLPPLPPGDPQVVQRLIRRLRQLAQERGATLSVNRMTLDSEGAQATVRRWQGAGLPDGVATFDDDHAIAVLTALQQAGVTVPEQVRVIGVDDTPLASFVSPALTSIQAEYDEYAKGVARAVTRVVHGGGRHRHCRYPGTASSCAPPPDLWRCQRLRESCTAASPLLTACTQTSRRAVPLSRKVRAFVALGNFLQRLHAMPSAAGAAAMPLAKRLAVRAPGWALAPSPAGIRREEHEVAGLKVRAYRGPNTPSTGSAGVLYIHGGGWTVGGLAGTDHICEQIAADTDTTVIALEYRFAPEHPYPAPLADCHTILRWLHENSTALGVDPERLIVAGDSAGGNLAAALALKARDTGPALTGQLLVYPALDHTRSTAAARDYQGAGLTAKDLGMCWELYGGSSPTADPLLSPLLADDLTGLPPALVITVEYDALRDDGRVYADRLRAAGVPCRNLHYDDYMHGVLSLPLLYEGVDEVWQEIATFLRQPSTLATP